MKNKFKVSLLVFVIVILGCFTSVFADTNQNGEVDENTKLLMHMDDSIFKDECGHSVINNGVTLDTDNKKFGTGSAYFNGSGYLTVSGTSDEFNMNDIDCMIDFWIKPSANMSDDAPICTSSNYNYANKTGW